MQLRHLAKLALAVCSASSAVVHAQPADMAIQAATTDKFPPGITLHDTPSGTVYADARGRVLYGMDMRILLRSGPDAAQYCGADCARTWEPLLAPQGSEPNIMFPRRYGGGREDPPSFGPGTEAAGKPKPMLYSQKTAPDWTIIAGAQGPQWVYKGWHMVFTRRDDTRGSTEWDGAENRTWNTLKYLPPAPKLAAPVGVQPLAVSATYVLAQQDGRVLFTGACAADCASWEPFGAGMASKEIGQWAVRKTGDAPQWTFRGEPVFVAAQDEPTAVPSSGKVLRP
ncbi:MAG: hypothetical protein ABIT04_09725 [Novosphingobium sp.]